jgi:hypothetical protein
MKAGNDVGAALMLTFAEAVKHASVDATIAGFTFDAKRAGASKPTTKVRMQFKDSGYTTDSDADWIHYVKPGTQVPSG